MASTIEFRYLRNVMTLIGGEYYAIKILPGRMVMKNTPEGEKPVLMHSFDLGSAEKPFVITMPDCTPKVPPREKHPEWSDKFFDRVCEAAITKALEEREKAAQIVADLRRLVTDGVIEIVKDDDSVMEEDLALTDVVRRAAGLDQKEPAVNLRVANPLPSQIARAAEAASKGKQS